MEIKDLTHVGTLYGLPVYTTPEIPVNRIWLGYIKRDSRTEYGLYANSVQSVASIEGNAFQAITHA